MKENGFTLEKASSRQYPTQTIMDTDYTDDIALLASRPIQAESLLHNLQWAAGSIGFHVTTDKMVYMYFNQSGNISILNSGSLKLVDKFTFLGSSISFSENDINMQLAKTWTAIDRLSIKWKSDLSAEMKCNFSKQQSFPY